MVRAMMEDRKRAASPSVILRNKKELAAIFDRNGQDLDPFRSAHSETNQDELRS
jgi:hypothetical protein